MRKNFKKRGNAGLLLVLFIGLAAIFLVGKQAFSTDEKGSVEGVSTSGFDQFGYNETARLFNGKADGVDRNLDGMVWGDPTYANDRLVMKWNAEWDRGNDEGWANPPYKAWEDNEWNGKVPGGSGEVWHYKIVWNGPCTEGESVTGGGVCIWGQFAIIMSQGSVDSQHYKDLLAKPAGYGAYFKN